jgi:hypothetical protein
VADEYEGWLVEAGLTPVKIEFRTADMGKHYATFKYHALTKKKAQLLGKEGVS